MLTNPEIERITNDFVVADNKRATDIYFESSWLLNYLMKQRMGLWKMPDGGQRIQVPLRYDGAESGFYQRNDTLSEDEREIITNAFFGWRHAFGNATIYRTDELENAGEYAEVMLVTERVSAAMESASKVIAQQLYAAGGDSSKLITGLQSLVSETSTTAYGTLTEDGLVAKDGTKPWEGKTTVTSEAISLAAIRALRSSARFNAKRPDCMTTTEDLYTAVLNILQVQQRYTENKDVTATGFTGLTFDGAKLVVDDYCPSGWLFALNSKHVGFAVHKKGYFARTPWTKLTSGAQGRTMKILWDGNLICNNRQSHAAHSNLSTS